MTPPSTLTWLHSELDRSRTLIAEERVESWKKCSAREPQETVTNIDLAVQRVLTNAIQEKYPGAAILAEEADSPLTSLEEPVCFVIDPIDGTDELVAGRKGYAISVALFLHGAPVAAVVDMPAFDRRFECSPMLPTTLNGTAVRLHDRNCVGNARLAVSASQYNMGALQRFWHDLGAAALVPTPAFAAKFCSTLAGDSDAAIYLPVRPLRTAIWDYAGVALLLQRAGGQFMSANGGDLLEQRPLSYQGGWIASPPALGQELLEVSRSVPSDLVQPAAYE